MKKITYIDYKGEKVTRNCWRVVHYKNYIKINYEGEYKGKPMLMYEDVKYKNVIKEEEVR